MSYSKLVSIIDTAASSTLLRDVYYSHHWSKLDGVEKRETPFMWVNIQSVGTEFQENENMWDEWSINTKIYLMDKDGRSRLQLTKEEVQAIDEEIDFIRSQFHFNLRQDETIDSITFTGNSAFPMYNNGAVVWSLDFTVRILNDNDICHDC